MDRDTLLVSHGRLRRIDEQLIGIFTDAQTRLCRAGFTVAHRVFMNGFSASGTFVNRFAALHPEWVRSIAAGGVNAMPIIPLSKAQQRELRFHVGVRDIEAVTGKAFDLEKYKQVSQYVYMGYLDRKPPQTNLWVVGGMGRSPSA